MYRATALLLAGFYIATSLFISFHRWLWYDEIFTAIASRMPDFHTLWKSLSDSTQQIPPLYFVITRICDQLLHHADGGIRIPSAIALGVGMYITFDIVRRLTNGLYGLIAMMLLTTSFVTYYGYEARPYAIYFMLASAALWLWVSTCHQSKWAAAAFGLLFLVGMAIHYFFVLCLVPFGLLALAGRRIFHPKVIAGSIGILGAVLLFFPLISSSGAAAGGTYFNWAPPTMVALQSIYLEFFPRVTIPLVLFAVVAALTAKHRELQVVPMSDGERVSWLFFTMPLASFALALAVTQMFYHRYMIGAIPGIVVSVTCILWRHFGHSRALSLALLFLLGGFGIGKQLITLRHMDHIQVPGAGDCQEQTRQLLDLERAFQSDGRRHTALTDEHLFLQAWYYSKDKQRYEYVAATPWTLSKYAALRILPVTAMLAEARETAVIAPGTHLAETLQQSGARLKIRFVEPFYVIYLE